MIRTQQIFIIGDSHIGLSDGDEKPIVAWLERLKQYQPRALYLNGDVFHYLIGDPKFFTSSVKLAFAKLRELLDAGTAIHYVEGNRDFFIKHSEARHSVSEVVTEASFLAGDKHFFVIHGDMINDRDLPYRFWRRFSKNPIMRLGVKLIPKLLARRMVDGVEKKLAMSNFKHKTRLPVELMEAYGRKKGEEGVDMVVFGHFHRKLVVPAGKATVTVLPAWHDKGEALMVDPLSGESSFVIV